MSEIFISYKREERDKARSIAEVLVSQGYKVWWDIELLPGDRFADEIEAVIKHAKVAIVLWSEASVSSDFVRAEASLAHGRGILVPVRIDDCELPLPFNTYHTLDLHDWDGTGNTEKLSLLLSSIEKRIGPRALTQDTAEIEEVLYQPKGEVDYWKSISDREPQNIREYESYIAKYGENGIFYELAIIRIKTINDGGRTTNRKHYWNNAAVIATVTGTVIAGISLYLTSSGTNEPDVELCDEPIYKTVTDEKLCGTTIEKYEKIPPQPRTCRHKDFGQIGWQQIKAFTGSSGWRSGGSNQKNGVINFLRAPLEVSA